jgi:hypothetical protein
MSPLVKKEVRLLLPSWTAALLLALVQAVTQPYDFYIACLLFIGLTIMALTSMGRETSLNTFSLMLAQPAERLRIWQTKLTVLSVAFLTVLTAWLVCFFISGLRGFAANEYDDYGLFIAVCLVATATFTGGLWTTLLLRQLTAAIWVTLLVPATLSGITGGFFVAGYSGNAIIVALCAVFAVYSIGGFLFARWLFFHAQDVAWSGGVITLPDWPSSAARRADVPSPRNRKPIFALLKKEFQLHQVTLMGAVGLLALHIGILVLRRYHPLAKESAGEVLACIFWMLWLVFPLIVSCLAVAEERQLGVMEGQLCQPASRRIQFGIKIFVALFLSVLLGGVMPIWLEIIGIALGAPNPAFTSGDRVIAFAFPPFFVIYSTGLALVCFFASSLAKNFLQAVGFAIATFTGFILVTPVFTSERLAFYGSLAFHSILPLIIAIPTLAITLLWLAYLNYNHFRDGWPLWRRNGLGLVGAVVFVFVASTAIYNRVWEVFEPAEPAHGPARLTVSPRLTLKMNDWWTMTILLPDGRVRFVFTSDYSWDPSFWSVWHFIVHPLPKITGPQKIIAGSNWVSAIAGPVNGTHTWQDGKNHIVGRPDTVGIRSDGTLWVSDNSNPKIWAGNQLSQFGGETNWWQVVRPWWGPSVWLLKKDGTLWRWGTNRFNGDREPQSWSGLRAFQPYQIGTDSDWKEITERTGFLARKSDGTTWTVEGKGGTDNLLRATNFDGIPLHAFSRVADTWSAYVRADGTLWFRGELRDRGLAVETRQCGQDTNWVALALRWYGMVALKADGTLWQWDWRNQSATSWFAVPPTRLGIHNDWVGLANSEGGVVALAADGSLWLWPDREYYEYRSPLLKLPKQPQLLGNVFDPAD